MTHVLPIAHFAAVSYTPAMNFRELSKHFDVEYEKLRYWDKVLKKHGLIAPKDTGIGHDYSETDLEQFKTLEMYLKNGAKTVTEALRLMKGDMTPGEAMEKYRHAQRQIEVLHKKVLQLRKPIWKRLIDWLKSIFSVVLPPRKE